MRLLALFLLTQLLGACTYSMSTWSSGSTSGDVLRREIETPAGPETWRLKVSPFSSPRVHRTSTEIQTVAHLGVSVKDLGREFAQARGLKVGEGVVVTSVTEGSAAEAAGVQVNDVLRALDGEPLVSQSQLVDLVRSQLRPGIPALLRRQSLVEADGGWVLKEQTVTIVPDASTLDTTASTAWDLDVSDGVEDLTGLQVAHLPRDLAAPLLDSPDPAVVVTSVMHGSPAYLAGLRPGDHIESLDGQPLTELLPLVQAVVGRAQARGLELPRSARHVPGVVERDSKPTLEVRGPLGDHSAELAVRGDLDDDSSFFFPWIFDWESEVQTTEWKFLYPLGFQIGPTYAATYVESETRSTNRNMHVSFLPLRLLDYKRRYDKEELRFLWLIKWEL